MELLVFLGAIAIPIFSLVLYFSNASAMKQDHLVTMNNLQLSRTMTEEDCNDFHIYYGKKIPEGAPVYQLRGEVVCHITRYNGNETKEYSIANIKIDYRCERDLRNRGVDLYAYVQDSDFLNAEVAPLIKKLRSGDLSEEEKSEIRDQIAAIEDEHVGVTIEFTFLNPEKTHKPAFITGIDLWNINSKRIKDMPQKKRKKKVVEEELVSFDVM